MPHRLPRDAPLPYGAPLSTIEEEDGGDTIIMESTTSSSASHTPSRKVFAALTPHNGEYPGQYSYETCFLEDISVDELSADTPQAETEEQKIAQRLKNAKNVECRLRLVATLLIHNLNKTLAVVEM